MEYQKPEIEYIDFTVEAVMTDVTSNPGGEFGDI